MSNATQAYNLSLVSWLTINIETLGVDHQYRFSVFMALVKNESLIVLTVMFLDIGIY